MQSATPNEPRCPQCNRSFQIGREKCMWCGTTLPEIESQALELLCPECGVQMTEQRNDWMRIYLCPSNCGLWIPAVLMKRLEDMHKKNRAQKQTDILRNEKPELRQDVKTEGLYRRCPQCDFQMSRKRYQRVCNVVVDECLGHGVWFDTGEFERVVDFLKSGGMEIAQRAAAQTAATRGRATQLNDAQYFMSVVSIGSL